MGDLAHDLGRHPFVAGLSPDHVGRLLPLARRVEFAAGAILFEEGDSHHEFFLIERGRVAVELVPHGEALRVDTLEPGAALGWSAVLLGRGKHFQARALEPVTALVFPGLEVLAACRADPAFGFEIMHRLLAVVSKRLQSTRLQVLDSYWPVAKKAGA